MYDLLARSAIPHQTNVVGSKRVCHQLQPNLDGLLTDVTPNNSSNSIVSMDALVAWLGQCG